MDAIDRLDALASDITRRFDAIREHNRTRMQCGEGCTDCCRCRLSLTRVEAEHLRRGLKTLPLEARRELSARATAGTTGMCPALDTSGRCQIYRWRPLVCRSQGAPLRYRHPVPLIQPDIVDVCDKNFVGVNPASEDVIDHTGVLDSLAEIDADYCDERGMPRGHRIPLADILTECD